MTNIFAVSDDAVDRWIEVKPFHAVEAGLLRLPTDWPDLSPTGMLAARTVHQDLLDRAKACDVSTDDEALAKRILVDELTSEIRAIDDELYTWDLNNLASPWQGVIMAFDLMTKETSEDWRGIAHLLETIPVVLGSYRESLQRGIELDFPPARRQVLAAIEQGRVVASDTSTFIQLAAEYTLGDDQFTEELAEAVATARQAFSDATDWLETVLFPAARETDGVGEQRYARAAQGHLGKEVNLRASYDWGWSEIAMLTNRLTELSAQIDPNKTVAEVMTLLKTDPERAAHGSDEFLAMMLERQQIALDNLAGVHFEVPNEIRSIEVKAPPEGGATAAYYTGPSSDFKRPGCVWYPLYGRTMFPLYEEVTTAYHEGFPGHHLQVGFARTLSDRLSNFHRTFVWHPGAGEGWALYAERLMGELGYLEKPDYEIGLITSQLFRSCRVVIDIGSHLGLPIPDDAPLATGNNWDFDAAVKLLMEVAYVGVDDATSEVTRYLGWPGQAISYKLGEQAIVDLREELQAEPGFDLKQFHKDLLTVGAVGLDVLSELVRAAQRERSH